jgi:hypothetical protein
MQPRAAQHSPLERTRLLAVLAALGLTVTVLAGCEELADTTPGPPNGEVAGRVPLEIIEGAQGQVIVLIPVFIGGEGPFGFALDTGASISLVDSSIVEQLNLEVVGETGPVMGVGGVTRADLVEVREWRLGEDVTLSPMTISSLELPEPDRGGGLDGLLGNDVLGGFGTIFIDYDEGFLVLDAELAEPATP